MSDCIREAARFLMSEPAAVERALLAHRERGDGRCTGCGHSQRWPCAPASTAMLAWRLLHPRARLPDSSH